MEPLRRKYKVVQMSPEQKENIYLKYKVMRLEEELEHRQGRIANLEDRIRRSGLVKREDALKRLDMLESSLASGDGWLSHHLGKLRGYLNG